MMPLTLNMENLYGREMCYRMGTGSLPTAQAKNTGYRIGDISYWRRAAALLFYTSKIIRCLNSSLSDTRMMIFRFYRN